MSQQKPIATTLILAILLCNIQYTEYGCTYFAYWP